MSKIAVVVGHRKHNQGAVGNDGESEWEYNKKIAEHLADMFDNVKVFYRDEEAGGYGEKMKRLHKRIDKWGADYSLSLHFNAADNESVDGHEVLYCSKRGGAVATILNDILDKHLGNRDRGIKKVSKGDRGGGFLCRGHSVCVLAEPFFAAHKSEYPVGKLVEAYAEFIQELG